MVVLLDSFKTALFVLVTWSQNVADEGMLVNI